MKKRMRGLLLALVMVCALLPATVVTALGVDTAVYVGSTNVAVSEGSSYWVNDSSNGGVKSAGATADNYNVKYTAPTATTPATLTLKGASITQTYTNNDTYSDNYNAQYGIYAATALHIVLADDSTNTVNLSSLTPADDIYGVYAAGKLTISGTGSFSVTASASAEDSYGICANSGLDIMEGTVNATGGEANGNFSKSYGINAADLINITGGMITATGGDANGNGSRSHGINANTSIAISNGTITANGGTAAGNGAESFGIKATANITITGGTTTATGGSTGFSGSSNGFYAYSHFDITGGTVTAKGKKAVDQKYPVLDDYTTGYTSTVSAYTSGSSPQTYTSGDNISSKKYFNVAPDSDQTPAPLVSAAAVGKTSVVQKSVAFTLTNTPALTGTCKVYDAKTGGSEVTGVTAAISGATLTLTASGTDLGETTYYVSVTAGSKTESHRLLCPSTPSFPVQTRPVRRASS